MTITDKTDSVQFAAIARTRDIFKAHIRDIELNVEEESIAISVAGCDNTYQQNQMVVNFDDVTSPVESTVSDLYDTILGYITT